MSNYTNNGMGNPSPSFNSGSDNQNNLGGSYKYEGSNTVNGNNNSNINSNINSTVNATNSTAGKPTKISIWTKIKDFMLQDITDVRLTEREQRFVNFWTQEVTIDKVYNFLFQEIKFK